MQVKKQQLELDITTDWFQIGKGVCQGCILSPCLFSLRRRQHPCEMPSWMKYKLESRFPGEIPITSYTQMTPPLQQKTEELERLLMKVKEESEKAGLKLNIQNTKIMASGPITSWQIDRETVGAVTDFIFLGSKMLLQP